MKEPQLTCPSVDDMQELLCEISNTGVLEDELKDLTNNILKAVKNQYDFYTNDVSDQLEVVRRNNMDLREWGKNLESQLSESNDILREGCQELKYLENFFCNDHLDAVKAREFLIKAELFLKPLTVNSEGK